MKLDDVIFVLGVILTIFFIGVVIKASRECETKGGTYLINEYKCVDLRQIK